MSDVVCADGVHLLMDYLDGALTAEQREAIDAHVAGCQRCVAFIESYQATPIVLRAATAVEMPQDLQASLLASLRRHRGGVPPV
jgi:anti-sigma factor RsiW